MRWLTDEEGATAVIIGILLIPLIGFGALVIDVGLIYWETRQLQNGADAAALAIAQECVEDTYGDCGPHQAIADDFTDFNANDDRADAAVQLPGLAGPNSVTVTATTRTAEDSTRLSYALAGVLGADFNATFARPATAKWGALGGGTTIPIGVCERVWDHFTDDGNDLPSGPPADILRIGVPNGHLDEDVDCTNPGGGDTPPGGFAFLAADGECMAEVYDGEWIDGSTGNNPDTTGSSACDTDLLYKILFDAVNSGDKLLVPIFDRFEDQGSKGRYRVIGFGAFKLEGYSINGGPKPSNTAHGRDYQWSGSCPGSASCLQLYFTGFVSLDGEFSSGDDDGTFGTKLVRLVG